MKLNHRLIAIAGAIFASTAFGATSVEAAGKPPQPALAGDPTRGQAIYQAKCSGCHSIDQNRIGPKHRGVVGRKAGSVAGYDYSPALKTSGVTWSAANLDVWLKGPIKFIPGVRMGFSVADAKERADIIAYLATQK